MDDDERFTGVEGMGGGDIKLLAMIGSFLGWKPALLTIMIGSLTGTLTIESSTDEPTGATTTFTTSGVRVSNSAGDGLAGYNFRTADGSPFGNAWYGVTTSATLTVNLPSTNAADFSLYGFGGPTLGGGIIPEEDVAPLKERGVLAVFGPGTNTDAVVEFICGYFQTA